MQVVATFDPSIVSVIPTGMLAGRYGGTFDIKNNGKVKFSVKNDSNISIHLYFTNGQDTIVAAGEEMLFCVDIPSPIVAWMQDSVLNVNGAPLVSKVYVTNFNSDDRIQGTYPFHITRLTNVGNNVPLNTSVDSISNEGNAAGTLFIDGGTPSNVNNIGIYNDHAVIKAEQSGIAHTCFQAKTSGNPAIIGQSGDTSEVLGSLQVDQNMSLAGTINGVYVDNNSGGSYGRIGHDSTHQGDILDVTTGGTTYIKNPDSNGRLNFQSPNGTTKWTLSAMSTFTGTGTGTYSHGLGTTPDIVIVMTHVNGSQTVGYDSENSTTVHITCGAGLAFKALAIKF